MFKGLKSQSGSVLVLVLATLTVMLIIAVGFTTWFMQSGRTSAFHRTEKKRFGRADAGVERAILRLNEIPNFTGTFSLTIDGRIVNVTVE